jgi:hypothetical protein
VLGVIWATTLKLCEIQPTTLRERSDQSTMTSMMRFLTATVAILVGASTASADSNRVGLSMSGGTAPIVDTVRGTSLVGTQVAMSHWVGRFGVSAEGAALALVSSAGGVFSVGLAGHIQLAQYATIRTALDGTRSPLSLGMELEAVAQHQWWDLDRDTVAPPTMFGVGFAVTATSHDDRHVVGIRADVRLLVARDAGMDAVARRTSGASDESVHGVLVTLGTELGAVTN